MTDEEKKATEAEGAEQEGNGEGSRLAAVLANPDAYLTEGQRPYLEPLGTGRTIAARATHAFFGPLARLYFRLRVEGQENIPAEGPFVLTPNHVSYLDPVLLALGLQYRVLARLWWVAWAGAAFANPFTAEVSRLAKAVPIAQNRDVAGSLAAGAAVLARGHGLVWFPEGMRSPQGTLRRFLSGLGLVLMAHPVPVVPVCIRGAYEAMPRGRALPRPAKVSIVIGKPVRPEALLDEGEGRRPQDRMMRALQRRVADLCAGSREPEA